MMDHPYPTFTPSMTSGGNKSTQRSGTFKVGVNPWGGLWALSTGRGKSTQKSGTFKVGVNPWGGDPALRQSGK